MITKIIVQLLLLPVVIIGVPLMFAMAWLHEAIDDRKRVGIAGDAAQEAGAEIKHRRATV